VAVHPERELAFDEDDLSPAVALMDELAASGAGWINFTPEVAEGERIPPRGLVVSIFSARGEPVPLVTWTAPTEGASRVSLGIEHGSGPRALPRLDEMGLGLHPGWLKVADHAKRGVVVSCPAHDDHEDVLWWLLAAGHALSAVELTGSWLAQVYRPAR
jgi:hypothetical protein